MLCVTVLRPGPSVCTCLLDLYVLYNIIGQSSSPTAEGVGLLTEPLAELGKTILQDGLASITGDSFTTTFARQQSSNMSSDKDSHVGE